MQDQGAAFEISNRLVNRTSIHTYSSTTLLHRISKEMLVLFDKNNHSVFLGLVYPGETIVARQQLKLSQRPHILDLNHFI